MLKKVSPTQISAFEACPRKWYFGWILKQKPPQSDSQRNGSTVHKTIEDFMQGQTDLAAIRARRDGGERFLASTVTAIEDGKIPVFPAGALIEERTSTLSLAGVPMNGLIDLVLPPREGRLRRVRDWKTCKNFRFAKSPDELRHDIQAASYCGEVAARGADVSRGIEFEHFYLSTQTDEYRPVVTILDSAFLDQRLLDLSETVARMNHTSGLTLTQVPKDTTACHAFGGCPHMALCYSAPVALDPKRGIMAGLGLKKNAPAPTPEQEAPAKRTSLLANKLEAAAKQQPAPEPPPSRKDLMLARIEACCGFLDQARQAGTTAETFATFSDDMCVLVEIADSASPQVALNEIEEQGYVLDDLTEEEWAGFYGETEPRFVPASEAYSAPAAPEPAPAPAAAFAVNPPDAAPAVKPTAESRDLRSYGLGGRSAAPLERNGLDTLPKLMAYVQSGKSLADLDGVGTTAQIEALALVAKSALAGVTPAAAAPSDGGELDAAYRKIKALETEIAQRPVVEYDYGETPEDTLTLYIGCTPTKGITAVEIEDVLSAVCGDLTEYFNAGYDDGKKAIAASVLANAQAIRSEFPHITVSGGMLSFPAAEALIPFADRIVRGIR